jgi:hypothetical protein
MPHYDLHCVSVHISIRFLNVFRYFVVLIKYEKCHGIPNCEILLTDEILLQLDIIDLPIFYSSPSR